MSSSSAAASEQAAKQRAASAPARARHRAEGPSRREECRWPKRTATERGERLAPVCQHSACSTRTLAPTRVTSSCAGISSSSLSVAASAASAAQHAPSPLATRHCCVSA